MIVYRARDKKGSVQRAPRRTLNAAHELSGLERIEDNMMRAIDRVPAVGEAGIKRVINGPMIWSPDSNVLFGPHPDLRYIYPIR